MSCESIYEQTTSYFLAPIRPLMEDDSVSEVMVVGAEHVYFERRGRLHRSQLRFPSEARLLSAVRNIAEYCGRRIDGPEHSLDGRLPEGHRVHAIVPPASRNGICLTIRKFQKCFFGTQQLVEQGALCPVTREFLEICVAIHKNIVVAGGTGTGKTTMLNALSTAIPDDERIIVIEDSSELQLQQPHTVYLEAQPASPDGRPAVSIRDLFVDSLRMRPDRIVVGEVRRGEALDLVQSMISGHAGSLTTVHANTPRDAASRLETLCLMSDAELPVYVARQQVASAVHLVLQLGRLTDGTRRVLEIAECLGLDDAQQYHWNSLFRFEACGRDESGRINGRLIPTGNSPSFSDEPHRLGLAERVQLARDWFKASS